MCDAPVCTLAGGSCYLSGMIDDDLSFSCDSFALSLSSSLNFFFFGSARDQSQGFLHPRQCSTTELNIQSRMVLLIKKLPRLYDKCWVLISHLMDFHIFLTCSLFFLGLFHCTCMYITCMPGALRVHKMAPDLLELELWVVVSDHVGSANQTQVFYKNKKYS